MTKTILDQGEPSNDSGAAAPARGYIAIPDGTIIDMRPWGYPSERYDMRTSEGRDMSRLFLALGTRGDEELHQTVSLLMIAADCARKNSTTKAEVERALAVSDIATELSYALSTAVAGDGRNLRRIHETVRDKHSVHSDSLRSVKQAIEDFGEAEIWMHGMTWGVDTNSYQDIPHWELMSAARLRHVLTRFDDEFAGLEVRFIWELLHKASSVHRAKKVSGGGGNSGAVDVAAKLTAKARAFGVVMEPKDKGKEEAVIARAATWFRKKRSPKGKGSPV